MLRPIDAASHMKLFLSKQATKTTTRITDRDKIHKTSAHHTTQRLAVLTRYLRVIGEFGEFNLYQLICRLLVSVHRYYNIIYEIIM